jgi:BirA family biotin operon repressor/biotin-[acetyl-CoA-carboxylase] ligase
MNDLSDERLAELLKDAPLGFSFRRFEETGSTNEDAFAWAKEDAPHGALVLAEAQTRGKGRLGRRWQSVAGKCLLFTLILRPRHNADRLSLLGGAFAVSLARVLRGETGLPFQTKWPNDVWLDRRKIAGILIEASWTGDRLLAVAAGIGINVNLADSELPEADTPPTSLLRETGRVWDRGALLRKILDEASVRLAEAETRPDSLLAEWEALELTLGCRITATNGDRTLQGTALGLLPDGSLRVKTDKSEKTLRWGESKIRF